jgi:hypothetical protein
MYHHTQVPFEANFSARPSFLGSHLYSLSLLEVGGGQLPSASESRERVRRKLRAST